MFWGAKTMMSYGGQAAVREISYMFIDAGSLRGRIENVSRRFFNGQPFKVNYAAIRSGFTKAFLYDAIPVRKADEEDAAYEARIAEIIAELAEAARVDGLHVYTGDVRSRKRRGPEQKKVDIMIAVDMLTHTFRGNMSQANLLTGDLDFKPLLDALVREGMFTRLWYPPEETSEELMNAADARQPITLQQIYAWLKPEYQEGFAIPKRTYLTREMTPKRGTTLLAWAGQRGLEARLMLYENVFTVVEEWDSQSVYVTRGGNLDLLRLYLSEQDIALPSDEEIAAARTAYGV